MAPCLGAYESLKRQVSFEAKSWHYYLMFITFDIIYIFVLNIELIVQFVCTDDHRKQRSTISQRQTQHSF